MADPSDPRPAVLFVCLGNICRSPLAEAAFRAAAERHGADVQIDSAGTGNWHAGEPPDPRSREMARRHGLDISGQRARQVRAADFEAFSHIVAMDHENLAALARMRPEGARAELSLLLDHVPGREGQAVGDPYYGGPEGFERAWADADAAAEGLLRRIAGAA
ncbi:low molecular weight protein-tyrosine-phosphatase [Oceaniglobus roseus]|uniref:low molecular weight protein-tyrosine-phosphatase n=1 Tax=Oceaniglobus roseus TaxID=1737570 RepID=UPI000C7EE569|nr:low molecular weight protein-tyrosine-phosphatase [Kandeliimicrobium roseum]